MDVIRSFHIHFLFHYDGIDTSFRELSLHALAKGGGGGGKERENPSPCPALPLKIQTWGVVEIGVS